MPVTKSSVPAPANAPDAARPVSAFSFLFAQPCTSLVDASAPGTNGDDVEVAPGLSRGDARHLADAVDEAALGVGTTSPNPPVGAIVVTAGGDVVGRGHHVRAGEPHAEIHALKQAGERAKGATVFVSLEPCAHTGRTPPCTSALIDHAVSRVVIGTLDPNPQVNGRGQRSLREAGIDVVVCPPGELAQRAKALIAPFAARLSRARPWTVAKVAASLDGRVATRTGDSRWVTGPQSRALVHALRDRVDVIAIGSGTASRDDPALTVRDLPDGSRIRRHPRRVVIDGALSVDPTSKVFRSQPLDSGAPLVAHSERATGDRRALFQDANVDTVSFGDESVDLGRLFEHLAGEGATSVLVECGPRLFAALLEAELVDEIWWFVAPKVVGADGVAAVGALSIEKMANAKRFSLATVAIGPDALFVGTPVVESSSSPSTRANSTS